MRRNRSSRSILGTPLWVLSLPIIAVAWRNNNERWRNPLTPDGKRDTPAREWVRREICLDCRDETDHVYIEFVDEPAVESECRACKAVRVYEDGL